MATVSHPHGPLPPEGAFVVQMEAGTDVSHGAIAGRVEHVTSGHARRFASVGELLAFIGRALSRSAGWDRGGHGCDGGNE